MNELLRSAEGEKNRVQMQSFIICIIADVTQKNGKNGKNEWDK